jgi:predicted TIM-barrel fold metal-dependent hydrolase
MAANPSRRDFLKAGSAALAGAAICRRMSFLEASQTNTADTQTIPIVDTHQHLWDLEKVNLPWLENGGPKELNRSFVMSDYLEATKGQNIVKTVYMEVNVAPDHQEKEANYVIELCKKNDNPMAAAVVGGSPGAKEFREYAKKYEDNAYIKGYRTVLHDPDRPQGMCLAPLFVEHIKMLGDTGKSFDLCMRPGEVPDGVKLAEKCQKTRFVLDHCGNLSVTNTDGKLRKAWEAGIKAAAGLENMVCKISGIVVTAKKGEWVPQDLADNINFCLEAFGEDRVMFAGDWPVCTLRASFAEWVNALKWIVRDRPQEFQRKLFHDNAVKFYGLS